MARSSSRGETYEIGVVQFGLGQGSLSVFGYNNTVACPLKQSLKQSTHILAIINHQDSLFLFVNSIFVHNAPCVHVLRHH